MSFADSTIRKQCRECLGVFDCGESEAWKKLCFPCWKRSKATTNTDSQAWYQRGYEAGHASAIAMSEAAPAGLDKARIRQLLQLVHPDRHNGSALANEVTTWLLALRKDTK